MFAYQNIKVQKTGKNLCFRAVGKPLLRTLVQIYNTLDNSAVMRVYLLVVHLFFGIVWITIYFSGTHP